MRPVKLRSQIIIEQDAMPGCGLRELLNLREFQQRHKDFLLPSRYAGSSRLAVNLDIDIGPMRPGLGHARSLITIKSAVQYLEQAAFRLPAAFVIQFHPLCGEKLPGQVFKKRM